MKLPRVPATILGLGSRTRAAAEDTAPIQRLRPDDEPVRTSTVDNAIYQDGRRVVSPGSIPEALAALQKLPDAMAWIGLYRPNAAELAALEDEFSMHPLALEDAISAHQRPKLERYGSDMFVVLRAASYSDQREEVDFGELHLFVGSNFVVTVRHSEKPDLSLVRRRMEADPELLRVGPVAVLYAILDAVVDQYSPVVAGLENDIDEIEAQVFEGDPAVSRRIYELSQEVLDFQRAVAPLTGMLGRLVTDFEVFQSDVELRRYIRDVADHVALVTERVDGFRTTLREILAVNATLVAQRQNEDMKKLAEVGNQQNDEVKRISAWAAIFFAPTMISSIYGMNFDVMPELHVAWGYPAALAAMLASSVVLHRLFKRWGWL